MTWRNENQTRNFSSFTVCSNCIGENRCGRTRRRNHHLMINVRVTTIGIGYRTLILSKSGRDEIFQCTVHRSGDFFTRIGRRLSETITFGGDVFRRCTDPMLLARLNRTTERIGSIDRRKHSRLMINIDRRVRQLIDRVRRRRNALVVDRRYVKRRFRRRIRWRKRFLCRSTTTFLPIA